MVEEVPCSGSKLWFVEVLRYFVYSRIDKVRIAFDKAENHAQEYQFFCYTRSASVKSAT